MTLRVWLFCITIGVGGFIGLLIFEFQTTMLWKAAAGKALFFFGGSVLIAYYFTRPGYLARLTSPMEKP